LIDKKEKPYMKQMIFKYGGVDLTRVMDSWTTAYSHLSFDDFLYMLPPVLLGITKMFQQNFIHLDIKPANVLYDDEAKKLYLIDFGLLSSPKQIKSESGVLSHTYMYYPPEFKFLNYKQQRRSLNRDQIERVILKNVDDLFMRKFKKYGYDFDDAVDFFETNNLSNFDSWTRTIDSYGIGMTLADLYYTISVYRGQKYKNKKFVKEALQTVITPMISLNPTKRIDAKEAHKRLTQLIEKYPQSKTTTNRWLTRALKTFSKY
jgi:serine/threonine protein kinase